MPDNMRQAPTMGELESYLPLVGLVLKRIAKKTFSKEEYEEMFQIGCEALVRSVKKYDPSKVVYVSYAYQQIHWALIKYLTRENRPIKYRRLELEIYNRIKKYGLLDHKPSEIASQLEIEDVELVEKSLELRRVAVISANTLVRGNDKDVYLIDTFKAENDDTELYVKDFLSSLDEREQEIIRLRIAGKSQDEIAELVGVSQPHVGRLLRKIGARYKAYLDVA